MALVIKNGKIITAVDTYDADLRIENEKIIAIGKNVENLGDEIVDASDCYLFPGAIDAHTHFDLDVGTTITADDFESGTKAAISGGTTTIIDFATQNKGETLKDGLRNWNKKAKDKSYCDYGFHMAITDWNEKTSKEMEDMVREGITSFKMYMAYKGVLQVEDGAILNALKRGKELGALIGFHCENGDIIDFLVKEAKKENHTSPKYHCLSRPIEAEKEAISRVISIAKITNSPLYIVHLSSKKGLEVIIKAKMEGQEVYVETCPQYLLLDDSCYETEDFRSAKYVMSPPLRKKEDNESLWNGLRKGYIDTIATDHCSFNFKNQKETGINDFSKIPNGGPGVEHRFFLIYEYGVLKNKISLNQMVALLSTNPAKLFGMFPQKGTIAVGSDADIVIWNPKEKNLISAKSQIQNVDYTPYENFEISGKIKDLFLRGNRLIKDYKLSVEAPIGKYIYRKSIGERD